MRLLRNRKGEIYKRYQKGDIVKYKLTFNSPIMQGVVDAAGNKIIWIRPIRNERGRFVRPLPHDSRGLPGTVKLHKLFIVEDDDPNKVFPALKR